MTDSKEYIEREALISICEQIISDDWNRRTAPESWADAYECFMEDVNEQPAADVVEVVRCKDCKFWDAVKNTKHAGKGICTPPNRSLGGYCTRRGATLEDDFCSFGERKERQKEGDTD